MLKTVPPLPRHLVNTWPVVLIGTGIWTAGFLISLILWLGSDRPPSLWLWTTLAGVVISVLGMGVMTWQHRGAQKTAQKTAQQATEKTLGKVAEKTAGKRDQPMSSNESS